MKYNKNSTKRRIKRANSKGKKIRNKIGLSALQIALIAVAYVVTYLIMLVLGNLVPGMKSIVYGFNFLLGVLATTFLAMRRNIQTNFPR